MNADRKTQACLLFMRVTVFVVMLLWTIDKFVNAEHAAAVYEKFYFIGGLGPAIMIIIGIIELLIVLAFVAGFYKTITYGLVTLFHAVATVTPINQYLAPYQEVNLLFFAAWPMLAACITLFVLRDQDRLLSVG